MRTKLIATLLILYALLNVCWAESIEARQAFKLGYNLLEQGKFYPAIDNFKLAINDHNYPLADYAYYYIGLSYQKSHNPELALSVFKTVADYFPDSLLAPQAWLSQAKIQIELQQYLAANNTLRGFIAQYPNDQAVPEARYLLGECLEKQGQYVDAARVYRNIDLLHPNSFYAEKAIDRLDALAKTSPLPLYEAPAATIYNLGVKYFAAANYKKAQGYFTRLTKFYKNSSFYDEALMMHGRIALRKGQFDLAAKYFQKCINQDKDSKAEAILYLGITQAYQDDFSQATNTLEKITTNYPNSDMAQEALFYLGRYYTKQGNLLAAQQAYQKIVSDFPASANFSQALWQVGNIYYQNQDWQAAYDTFIQVNNLPADKVSDQIYFWLGKSAEKLDKNNQAVQAYKATISLYDHSYYAYRAREELKKHHVNLSPKAVPEPIGEGFVLDVNSALAKDHAKKYQELLALDLGDEAADEAAFIADQAPQDKKDLARLAQYHAYVTKGKFSQPINFADKKIAEAVSTGKTTDLDPRVWRFAYPRGYWNYVEKYAAQYNLDPYLVYAVIREESRFKSQALSRSYAQGLMQVMPGTAKLLADALDMRYSRWKTYQPRVNIQMGTYYLAGLIKRFDGNVPLALAGYNGGPNRVKKWLKGSENDFDLDEFVDNIPIIETRNYVKKVMKSYYGYQRTYGNKG